MDILNILILIVGFVFLIKGADFFVEGASDLSYESDNWSFW